MKHEPIHQSSNIESIGYDPETSTLEVKFKSGGTWKYADVPPEAHKDFMAAHSKGAYFASAIRKNYKGAKL